jgi:hypothetical protein
VIHVARAAGARRRVAAVAEVVDLGGGEVGVRTLADAGRVVSPCRRPARRVLAEAATGGTTTGGATTGGEAAA